MRSKWELLRALPGLAPLPAEALERLCAVADVLTLAPGDILMEAGRRATHCVVLGAGAVEPGLGDRLLNVGHLSAQAAWLLVPTTVVARTGVTVLVIDRRQATNVAEFITDQVNADATIVATGHSTKLRPRLAR